MYSVASLSGSQSPVLSSQALTIARVSRAPFFDAGICVGHGHPQAHSKIPETGAPIFGLLCPQDFMVGMRHLYYLYL